MRLALSLFLFTTFVFAFENEFELENTNIVSKPEHTKANDYNRLRLTWNLSHEKYENFLFKVILDNYNEYDDELSDNENKTKIYRAYLKYSDEKNIVTIGKQRIPFGVGRVWNPIDIFNPIDATSIETDERKGTDSIRYEYAINDLSSLDATISEYKYAARVKGYLNVADIGFSLLKDEKKDRTIIGYETTGELFDTGIELRSEGGYFNNKNTKDYEEFIIGAEYGFENSLDILGEYKYNSLENQDYFALQLSYEISTLWNCSFLGIKNLDDKSSVSLVKFDYSLSDESELNFGYYLYDGDKNSEYGGLDNSAFLRYYIHF